METNTEAVKVQPVKARPVTVTTGMRLLCEPPNFVFKLCPYQYGTTEYWADIERRLKSWIEEFHNFIRDHRSQDPVVLSAERETKTVCSSCGNEWEVFYDEGVRYCFGCGEYAPEEK